MEDHCPASIRMSKRYPSSTSAAAEQGTAAHEMREFCLKLGVQPQSCLGMFFNGYEVDQEMVDGVSIDVNYVRRLEIEYGVKPLLEKRVAMSSLGRNDVYGTGDTLFISRKKRIAHVIDFKYGRGVVEIDNNSQCQGYGVSTLDTFDLWNEVDEVHTTIVQPRYQHSHGPIRTQVYTIDEMDQIADKFYRSVLLADDPTTKPNAGKWCKWCPARGNCRARMMRTLETAYRGQPIEEISTEELEILLGDIPSVNSQLDELKAEAVRRARGGQRYQDWKLVESRPRATCTNEKQLIVDASKEGIKIERLYDKKLKSRSSAQKVLPPKLVEKYYVSPPASDTLVPMSDKRVAKVVGHVSKGTFGKVSK